MTARRLTALVFALGLGLIAGAAGAGELEVGARAPEFTLQGSDGSTVTLEGLVGQRELVLAWFPKAFTPG